MKNPIKHKFWFLTTIILGFGIFCVMRSLIHAKETSIASAWLDHSDHRYSTKYTQITKAWSDDTLNEEDTIVVDHTPMKKGVFAQVMYDHDTNRIRDLKPIDYPGPHTNYMLMWRVQQFRIHPACPTESSEFVIRREPRPR